MKNYNEVVRNLKQLAGRYYWGTDEQKAVLSTIEQSCLFVRSGISINEVRYGVIDTADRGKSLVQFTFLPLNYAISDENAGGFDLKINVVEDGLTNNLLGDGLLCFCPKSVSRRVTDNALSHFLIQNSKLVSEIIMPETPQPNVKFHGNDDELIDFSV